MNIRRVRQAHPVDVVGEVVVLVDGPVLRRRTVVHGAAELGVEQAGELVAVVEGVAAAERGLLGQLGEGQEALRPAHRPHAASADGDRQAAARRARSRRRAERPGMRR